MAAIGKSNRDLASELTGHGLVGCSKDRGGDLDVVEDDVDRLRNVDDVCITDQVVHIGPLHQLRFTGGL